MKTNSRTILVVALGILAGMTTESLAQSQAPVRWRSALAIELEAVGGYTLVDLNTFALPGRVMDSDRNSGGFNGRLFFVDLGDARLGIEAGRHDLLWYHVRSADSTVQDTIDITSWYGGLVVRLPETRRFSFDFGMGMFEFPKSPLAFRDNGLRLTTSAAVYYRLLSYRGVTVPIGARISSIMDNRSSVLPASFTAGVQIRPFRGVRGR